MKLLLEIRDQKLIRPAVSMVKWRRSILDLIKLLIVIFTLTALLLPIIIQAFAYWFELYSHTLERYKQHQCKLWHPNGTLVRPSLVLPKELFYDSQEREAYESYGNGTFLGLLKLMLKYEAMHMYTNRLVFIQQLGMIILIHSLTISSVFWTSLFVLSSGDKIFWLIQIRAQLETCRRQLEQIKHRPKPQQPAAAQIELDLFLKGLTVTYINYELFRRQHQPYRWLTSLLVLIVISFSACGASVLYLVASRRASKFRLLSMFISGCVLFTLDLYLIAASYAAKLLELVMVELARLLAGMAAQCELLTGAAVNLWRRQLLDEHEQTKFSSIASVAPLISYRRILAFNLQLGAVWMLLMRVS